MINGDVQKFVEHIYYGDELIFKYNNIKFFLQGWTENNQSTMVLDIWNDQPFTKYVWECTADKMSVCAQKFLTDKIFNGKTFWDIEKNIEWLDD